MNNEHKQMQTLFSKLELFCIGSDMINCLVQHMPIQYWNTVRTADPRIAATVSIVEVVPSNHKIQ